MMSSIGFIKQSDLQVQSTDDNETSKEFVVKVKL